MKLVNFYRKPISVFVMVSFTVLLCFWANQAPAAPAPGKSSSATLESNSAESPSFIEREAPERSYKKGKGFPWLIVALVVVAGGAALYFLVLKKKNYTLTVTVGEGVTGTPAAGTSTNEKGTVVTYNYALQSGYSNLSVTLDGAAVAASGTVTMNANHTLAASSTKTFILTVSRGEHVTGTPNSGTFTHPRGTNVPYSYAPAAGYSNLEVKIDNVAQANTGTIAMDANHTLTATLQGANIVVNSTPAGARIYLNEVDSGFTTPHAFFFATAVTKTVRLRYSCGYKEHVQTVTANLGQTVTVNAAMIVGIHEDFSVPASSCWGPYFSASWTTTGEDYRYKGTATYWSPSVYYHSFSGDYTVGTKMLRKTGHIYGSNSIFLGISSSWTNASGYLFQYHADGRYSVYRAATYNFISLGAGTITAIKNYTATATVISGLNKWNSLKIVKAGSNYSFYINNTFVYSFNDAAYNPSYIGLISYIGNVASEIHYDYVNLDSGAGMGSVPGQPLQNMPAKDMGDFATGERIN